MPSKQDDLIKFLSDPETIKRAAEGSMEKRQKLLDSKQPDELENILGKALGLTKYDRPEYYEMTPFGGMWVEADGKTGRDLTGAVAAIEAYILEQQIDPFDYVEPCEPDCTPVHHARHEGQWRMAERISAALTGQKEKG